MLIVYVMICASQLVLRRRLEEKDPESLTLKMWFFPYLTIATMVGMLVVLGSMLFIDDVRSQLYWSVGSAAVLVVIYWIVKAVRGPARLPDTDMVGVGHVVPSR